MKQADVALDNERLWLENPVLKEGREVQKRLTLLR